MIECQTRQDFGRIFLLTCAVAVQTHEDASVDLPEAPTPKDARKKLENFISNGKITNESKEFDSEGKRDTPFRLKFAD